VIDTCYVHDYTQDYNFNFNFIIFTYYTVNTLIKLFYTFIFEEKKYSKVNDFSAIYFLK